MHCMDATMELVTDVMRLGRHAGAVCSVQQFVMKKRLVMSSSIRAARRLLFSVVFRIEKNVHDERCNPAICGPSFPPSQEPLEKVLRSCDSDRARPPSKEKQ